MSFRAAGQRTYLARRAKSIRLTSVLSELGPSGVAERLACFALSPGTQAALDAPRDGARGNFDVHHRTYKRKGVECPEVRTPATGHQRLPGLEVSDHEG